MSDYLKTGMLRSGNGRPADLTGADRPFIIHRMAFDGTRMRQLREDRGLTRHELAMLTGEREDNIKRWETTPREPRAHTLANLAQSLQTSTDYLLGLTDQSDATARNGEAT